MDSLTTGDFLTAITLFLGMEAVIGFVYMLVKKHLTKSRFFRFLGILAIGTACSIIPWGLASIVFGFPAVFIASVFVSCLLDRETK